jgi:ribosomal protein S18 acetylase RimI-like enzyme
MRQARQEDAPELAQLIQACGLDDNPNDDRIASVIRSTTRITLVEQADDGTLIGFIDAFMTVSVDGNLRWEIDLLGVHPAYRGRGIAQHLINASVHAGHEQGVDFIRALIHVDNAASTNAFQRCGFVTAQTTRELYISDQPAETSLIPPAAAHLIPVCTLTYSGIWIEDDHSPQSLAAARAIRAKYDWFIAGVLLPTGAPPPESFVRVGEYRWWTL